MISLFCRIGTFLATLVFATSFTIDAYAEALGLDKVIAIVNDEAITYSEYQTRLNRELIENNKSYDSLNSSIDPKLLQAIIDERLQAQIAQERGVEVSKAEIDNAIKQMAIQNQISVDALFGQLSNNRITEAHFKRSIKEQLQIRRYIDTTVNSRINITELEIDFYLQSHRELYAKKEVYELSHLFISTSGKSDAQIESDLQNMTNIAEAINKGLEFKKAVMDFSDGDNTEEGGYLGWRKNDQLPEIFLAELRKTPIGGVTSIITSSNGLHILKVHGKEGDLKIVSQQKIRHILIQPERRGLTTTEANILVQSIIKELESGVEFGKLARIHSDDISSSRAGGALGWVNPNDTVSEFESAAKLLDINQISAPIETRFGWHIIEVEDRRKKDIAEELARQSAQAEIYKRKSREQVKNWLKRIKDNAFIELVGP